MFDYNLFYLPCFFLGLFEELFGVHFYCLIDEHVIEVVFVAVTLLLLLVMHARNPFILRSNNKLRSSYERFRLRYNQVVAI